MSCCLLFQCLLTQILFRFWYQLHLKPCLLLASSLRLYLISVLISVSHWLLQYNLVYIWVLYTIRKFRFKNFFSKLAFLTKAQQLRLKITFAWPSQSRSTTKCAFSFKSAVRLGNVASVNSLTPFHCKLVFRLFRCR